MAMSMLNNLVNYHNLARFMWTYHVSPLYIYIAIARFYNRYVWKCQHLDGVINYLQNSDHLQCGPPKIAKLVYNSNNYGLWYAKNYSFHGFFVNQRSHHGTGPHDLYPYVVIVILKDGFYIPIPWIRMVGWMITNYFTLFYYVWQLHIWI